MPDQTKIQKDVATGAANGPDQQNNPVSIQQQQELVQVETISEDERSYPKPKGAFLFVILMMIFYFVYWTISYFEIFVIRGS